MRLIRNPDRCQFASTVQLGEVDRVLPIGLDPLTRPARDQRGSNDNANVSQRRQLPLDAVATGTGLTEPQFASAASKLGGSRC